MCVCVCVWKTEINYKLVEKKIKQTCQTWATNKIARITEEKYILDILDIIINKESINISTPQGVGQSGRGK